MSNLSELFKGGSDLPGDVRFSWGSDADLLAGGWYPAKGGFLDKSAHPLLAAARGTRGLRFTQTPAGQFWTYTAAPTVEGSMLLDTDGVELVFGANSAASNYAFNVFNMSTGAKVQASLWGSNPPTAIRYANGRVWVGQSGDGRVLMYNGPTVSNLNLLPVVETDSSYWRYTDFFEIGGYVLAASPRGIYRASTATVPSAIGDWTKVLTFTIGTQTVNGAGRPKIEGFYLDAESGALFFKHSTSLYRSTDGGVTWSSCPSPAGQSFARMTRPLRWNGALWMFTYNTPQSSPTAADELVFKSVDNGLSWTTSPMRLRVDTGRMYPLVVHGDLLFTGVNVGGGMPMRILRREAEGLVDPTTDPRGDIIEDVGVPTLSNGGVIFPWASEVLGVRKFNSGGGTPSAVARYDSFVPNFNPTTQFRLPVDTQSPPSFVKGG